MDQVQKEIIESLYVKPSIDAKKEAREIIDFMKNYVKTYSFIKSFVLGISGGQDSTLLGKLSQMAINELRDEGINIEFYAVCLPYGVQNDHEDQKEAIDFIQPDHEVTVNIKESVDQSVQSISNAGFTMSDFIIGNEKARERMKVQYAIAAVTHGIVLGTDHAAEAVTGFYTKHGDGACDIAPLTGLNKRQGRAILHHLNAPESLIFKVPTADLENDRPMLSDEVALGVTYEAIDDFLEGKSVSQQNYDKIVSWYTRTKHKRVLPYHRYHTP